MQQSRRLAREPRIPRRHAVLRGLRRRLPQRRRRPGAGAPRLPRRQPPRPLGGRDRFVILETGFGFGLNFLATWQAWRRDPQRCARLHYVSIEKHPFTKPTCRSLRPLRVRRGSELHARWPVLVPGAHRWSSTAAGRPHALLRDVAIARDLRLAADAFYLDGFAPAKNPTCGRRSSCARSRASPRPAHRGHLERRCRGAPCPRSHGLRRREAPGFGDKKEMLTAAAPKSAIAPPREELPSSARHRGRRGLRAPCARGWEVELYERHAARRRKHRAITPARSIPSSRPTTACSRGLHGQHSSIPLRLVGNPRKLRWDPCGVLQLARDAKGRSLAARVDRRARAAAQYAQYVTREEAPRTPACRSPRRAVVPAGGMDPPAVARQCAARSLRAGLKRCSRPRYRSCRNAGSDSCEFLGAPKLQRCRTAPAQGARAGHARAGRRDRRAAVVVLRGGMVLPPVGGVRGGRELRHRRRGCFAARRERRRQPAAAGEHPGQAASTHELQSRVAFRSVAPDRLPVAGKIDEGIYGAFAYGSRGLIWAALAAELIASQLEGEPLPLEGKLADAMSPLRFASRAVARGSRPSRP